MTGERYRDIFRFMAKKNANLTDGPGTLHPDYVAGMEARDRCRDCHDGEDAVKARETKYLPCPNGMEGEPDAYNKYLLRAGFLPAVERTEEVLSGLLFQEDPEIVTPADLDTLVEDVTLTGQPLIGMAQDAVVELLVTGRVAFLLDFVKPDEGMLRPYWSLRTSEDLINWTTERAPDGKGRLTRAMLREDAWVPGEDEYSLVVEHRVRELVLTDAGVVVRVHALQEGMWVQLREDFPMIYGEPMQEIPLLVANARQVGVDMGKPPLLPIANLVLSHYRTSADLEHGNYYASLPTAYAIGAKLSAGKQQQQRSPGGRRAPYEPGGRSSYDPGFKLGSGYLLPLPPGAEVGYLEISGPGLLSIHRTLVMKEKQLVAVGARLISDQSRSQAETAQTARIRAQSDASLMRLVANVIDQVFTTGLSTCARWMHGLAFDTSNVSFLINREFLDTPDPDEPKPEFDIDTWPTD